MNQSDLQAKLDALAWSGRAYQLPEKVKLTGPEPLKVEGCYLSGRHPAAPHYAAPELTTLEVTNTTTPAVEVYGPHAGLIGHVFHYPGQRKTGRPKEYPVTIAAPKRGGKINPNVVLRHLTFVGAWSFIHTSGGGQHVIEDVRGQLLGGVGIRLENAADVIRVDGVHFWPSFSGDEELMAWAYWNPGREGNARGIVFRQVDWPQLNNIFIYGAHAAIQVLDADSDPQFGNLAVDACSVACDIYHIGMGGMQIANFRVAGNRSHGSWKCIPILGRASIDRPLQIANMHTHGDMAGTIWEARNDLLQISNRRRS